MSKILDSYLAKSTKSTYKRAYSLFQQFSIDTFKTNSSLPISIDMLSMFISYLNLEGFAPASIISYTSALGYMHKISSLPDPTSAEIVQKLLSAITKISPAGDSRLPITILILERLVKSLDAMGTHFYHKMLLKAMFLTAFHGLFRISEITSSNTNSAKINMANINREDNVYTITITDFKHNLKKTPHMIHLRASDDTNVCPVTAIQQYLKVRGSDQGPLFVLPNNFPVTRNFFALKLKACLSFCNLDTRKYKSHSFRIGGSSYLAELGYSDAQIRIMGRWKSDAFKGYIRNTKA